jgi:four helix bundle protein
LFLNCFDFIFDKIKTTNIMTSNQKAAEFEDRLIDFAVRILYVADTLPSSYSAEYFCKQIVRSGSSPALLYGEARGAESKSDFYHKISVALKELRGTFVNLKLFHAKGSFPQKN